MTRTVKAAYFFKNFTVPFRLNFSYHGNVLLLPCTPCTHQKEPKPAGAQAHHNWRPQQPTTLLATGPQTHNQRTPPKPIFIWAHVCAKLASCGIQHVLIAHCDGPNDLAEAMEATWPDSMVQICVVHVTRAANRWAACGDRKAVSIALKKAYTTPDETTARAALDDIAENELGQ